MAVDGGDAPLENLETHPSESHSHKPESRRTAVAEIDEKAQVGVVTLRGVRRLLALCRSPRSLRKPTTPPQV